MLPILAEIPVGTIVQLWYFFVIPATILLIGFAFLTQRHRNRLTFEETKWKSEHDSPYVIAPTDRFVYYIFSFITYLAVLVLILVLMSVIITSGDPDTSKTLPVRSYGVLLAIGFIVGIALVVQKAKKAEIDLPRLMNMFIWLIVAAIVGARFFYMVWETDHNFFEDPLFWLRTFFSLWEGGMAAYGGIIFASITGILYLFFKKLPLGKVVDITAPSIAIGLMFGRLGCLMNGCCFGDLIPDGSCCHWFPIGIDLHSYNEDAAIVYPGGGAYTPSIDVDGKSISYYECYHDVPCSAWVYATQFWSAMNGLIAFILFSILYRFRQKMAFEGQIFLFFGMYYAITRATIELFRNDTERWFALTAAQWIGIAIFVVMLVTMIIAWIRSKNAPPAWTTSSPKIPTEATEEKSSEDSAP